jgi:hypothetical protein
VKAACGSGSDACRLSTGRSIRLRALCRGERARAIRGDVTSQARRCASRSARRSWSSAWPRRWRKTTGRPASRRPDRRVSRLDQRLRPTRRQQRPAPGRSSEAVLGPLGGVYHSAYQHKIGPSQFGTTMLNARNDGGSPGDVGVHGDSGPPSPLSDRQPQVVAAGNRGRAGGCRSRHRRGHALCGGGHRPHGRSLGGRHNPAPLRL